MSGADDAYDPANHALHTPTAVMRALRNFEERGDGLALVSSFCSVLVFDAWIGNGDRHPQNWALLSIAQGAVRRLRLAPMYDPANCLGVELQDDHPLLVPSTAPDFSTLLRKYINRCPSGFGDGGDKLITMAQVVEDLRREPCWRDVFEASVARFRVALDTQVSYLVEKIPEDWLSRPRKVLTCSLLRERLKWLESKGPPR